MSSTTKQSNMLQPHNNVNIPIQITDLSIFDDAFAYMKERFDAEMRRVDEQMTKFSTDLMLLYGQTSKTTVRKDILASNWEDITNSPLVQDEGEHKTLKLQFDVSQFNPDEVQVIISNNVLMVSAMHKEKTDKSNILREYNREVLLPVGTDPEAIVSSLSRDGVLTVQARLPQLVIENSPELP